MRYLLLLIFSGFFISTAFGQNNLKTAYKNAASTPNFLNVCGDPDTVVVVVQTEGLSSAIRTNIVASVELFKGVTLVSFHAAQSTVGVVLTNSSNPNKPVFSLPNVDPNGTNKVEIAFVIKADCDFLDTINLNNLAVVYDRWKYTYTLGTQNGLAETDETFEYRNAFKVPNLTIANALNTTPPLKVGDCYSREIIVANSALEGFVDSVRYTNLQGAGVSLNKLYVNGIEIPFTKTPQGLDTLITAYIHGQWLQGATVGPNPGDGDVFFDPNESIRIKEDVCLVSCTKSRLSSHTVAWGCNSDYCSLSSVNGFAQTGNGQPNAAITYTASDPANSLIGYCKPGRLKVTFLNNGSEVSAGFGHMKDVEVLVGMGVLLETTNKFMEITALTIAGKTISPIVSSTMLHQNAIFSTDPDGTNGLEDLDSDGFFDDMRVGNSFVVFVDYTLKCDSLNQAGADSTCLNNFNIAWNAFIKYTDPCANRVSKVLPSFAGSQNSSESIANCIDPDAYPNVPFTVQHTNTRSVRFFEKSCGGAERFVVWAVPPPGVDPIPAEFKLFKNNSTFVTTQTSFYFSGDTIFVEFDGTNPFLNGKYDIYAQFVPDCTVPVGRIIIPFGFLHSCAPCGCKHTWYCGDLNGPQFHPTSPPCASGVTCPNGIQTTSFDVERTTYGYTSGAYTTKVNPATINKDVAIHCDSVRITVKNVVGSNPISDSIGIVISYDNVDFLKDTNEIFLFDEALVRIHHGGQMYNCTLGSSDFTVDRGDTTKTLTFNLHPCLTGLGITLVQGDSINFFGDFMVNPNGPIKDNFKKVPNFRSYGFATINGVEYACDNYGKNFTVAKIPTIFSTPGGSSFPRGCSNTPFNYTLVTKNIGFGNEYVNEFYAAISVDSFVLNYDTLFLSTFQNPKVEVSFPGHPFFGNNFYTIAPLAASDHGRYVAKFDTLLRVPSYNVVQSYSFNLRISVYPTCESLTGSATGNNNFKMNPTIYYTDREFAKSFGDGSCANDVQEQRNQMLTYTEPPTMNFQSVTNPNLLLTNDTAEWIVNQCNTSTTADAGFTWIAARVDTSAMEIITLDLMDNPASIVSLPFQYFDNGTRLFAHTPGVLKQAGANTAAQICNTIRVRAIPKKCGTFPLQLETGWNCVSYTDPNWSPDEYAPCKYDSLNLQLTTLNPMVDATIINQPATYPSLCDTVETEMLIRNTGQGVLLDVVTRFSIPLEGATLVSGGVSIAYPSNAPYVQVPANPVLVGTTSKGHFYEYSNFDSLSQFLANNGLAGFDPLNPTLSNEFKIKYKFVTDCNFTGGVLNYYSYSGDKVCREKSNIKTGESFPIYFVGLEPPTTKSFETTIGNASYFANNDTSLIEIFAQNLLSTPTDTFDKISIKLPEGIQYVPYSTLTVAPSTWVIAEPEITMQGSITILNWRMPQGIGLNEFAKLRFEVIAPPLLCDGNLEIALSTLRETDYLCPNGSLACSLDVITSSSEDFIDIGVGQNGNFAGVDTTICPGSSLQISAFHPDYSAYQWSPSAGLSDANIYNPIATPISTTTYSVVAFDANGCSYLDELIVTVADSINITPTTFDATCSLSNGALSLNVTGLGAGGTYQWSPNVSSTSSATNLSAGIYSITVTNNTTSCSAIVIDTIQNLSSAINVTAISSPASNLQPNSGSIALQIANGIANYTISWSGQASGNASSTTNMYIIAGLAAGSYQVTVTSAAGCSLVVTATVTENLINDLNFQVQTASDNSCCESTGGMTIQAVGGTGAYSLSLVPNQGTVNLIGTNNFQVIDLPSGTYTVTLTDISGLTATNTVTIAEGCVQDPIQNGSFAGADFAICQGDVAQLSALHANFVSYQWLPSLGLSNTSIANPVAGPPTTTTYTVTALDVNGCSYSDELVVTVSDSLSITSIISPETCQLANGSISLNVSGVTANGVTYQWQSNISTSSSATNLIAGSYQVTVTDNGSGCTAWRAIIVPIQGTAILVTTTISPASNLMPISGSISLQVSGGNPDYTISWSGQASGNASSSTSMYIIADLAAGTYQITVTSAAGCSQVVTATVTENLINDLNFQVQTTPDNSCCESTGGLTIQAVGGTGSYSLSLVPNLGTVNSIGTNNFQVVDLPSGIYTVTLTDISGLTATNTVTVADGCVCGEIFDEEVIYEPSGVEGICIGIPYIFFDEYPIFVNGVQYTGPIHSCDIDTVVYYAFSFLNGNGFDGPYILDQWECNDVSIYNVEFYDLYDLVDSMNVWDPYGYWVLDDVASVIYGGDYLQSIYGSMEIHHPASNTPFNVMVNYTGFAYGTEIFVNPFDGKVVVTAYDSLTCCYDSVCVIFINPCDELIPLEPYFITTASPNICLPLTFANVDDYYIFVDQNRYFLPTSCDNGNGIQIAITGALGFHELIVIDTSRWCSDTVPIYLLNSIPLPITVELSTTGNTIIENICPDDAELFGSITEIGICEEPTFGILTIIGNCATYMPDTNYIGLDNFCLTLCDENGICDTTYYNVKIDSLGHIQTTPDTVYLTLPFETISNEVCLSLLELGCCVSSTSLTCTPLHGQITFSANCFTYSPDIGFVGQDTACVVLCNEPNICDTTYIFITVQPPVTAAPTVDTLYFTTPFETALPEFCLDLTEVGSTFAAFSWCAPPQNGTFTINQNCIAYTPLSGYMGTDAACAIVCNAAGVCDTTYIIITVQPPVTVAPTVDTLYFTTPFETALPEFCLDLAEIGNAFGSFSWCAPPQNGTFTINQNCVVYTPMSGYVGIDAACAIVCNAAGLCDTTYIFITVQPTTSDCGFFGNDTMVVETPASALFGQVCISNLPLDQVPLYQWIDNGQVHTNPWIGCDFDTCIYMGYFAIPDQGTDGPYLVKSWTVNGVFHEGAFDDIEALRDSMNAWDPTGDWVIEPATFTLQNCIQNNANYSTMSVEQPSTGGKAFLNFQNRLTPNGASILLAPGAHIVTVTGTSCIDTLWVQIVPSSNLVIDTFIYLNAPQDTICLTNYGVNLNDITDTSLLCQDQNGSDAIINYDSLSGCITYQGIDLGQDTLCLKLIYGSDSCKYVTVYVTVIEPLPCDDFISTDTIPGTLLACNGTDSLLICVDVPFTINNEFVITLDGQPATAVQCPPNSLGVPRIGIFVKQAGVFPITFNRSDLGCRDTVYANITCKPILYDTVLPIAVNDIDTMYSISTMLIPVLNNDTINGTLASLFIITPPLHGTAIMQNILLNYEPFAQYCNTDIPDSLQYVLCNQNGCDTAWVYISMPCQDFEIFDGFSPNSDGMNDFFHINGLDQLPDNEVLVFNRWGNQVYFAKPYRNEWAGAWNDNPLPDGVYFYLFKDGKGNSYSGTLTITR